MAYDAAEVAGKVGLVGVSEVAGQAGEGDWCCRPQLLRGFLQAVALDHPLGVNADVGSEAALERAHVERCQLCDLLYTAESRVGADSLDHVAHGCHRSGERRHHRAQKRFGQLELRISRARASQRVQPCIAAWSEHTRERQRAIREVGHRRSQQRLERRRAELHDEELSVAGAEIAVAPRA